VLEAFILPFIAPDALPTTGGEPTTVLHPRQRFGNVLRASR
jgi:hypothetical protein